MIIAYYSDKCNGIVLLNISTMRPNSILLNAYLPERYKIESGSMRRLVMVRFGIG